MMLMMINTLHVIYPNFISRYFYYFLLYELLITHNGWSIMRECVWGVMLCIKNGDKKKQKKKTQGVILICYEVFYQFDSFEINHPWLLNHSVYRPVYRLQDHYCMPE